MALLQQACAAHDPRSVTLAAKRRVLNILQAALDWCASCGHAHPDSDIHRRRGRARRERSSSRSRRSDFSNRRCGCTAPDLVAREGWPPGYCWGANTTGGLGTGGTASSRLPVKVAGGLAFADIQAGGGGACGLTTSGSVYCWGGSVFGRSPTLVRPDLQFAALAVGGTAGCELTTANDLYCFGY